jgi:hypothetical protein
MKEKALARLHEPDMKMRRFHPKDSLMRFLQALLLCRDHRRSFRKFTLGPAPNKAQ